MFIQKAATNRFNFRQQAFRIERMLTIEEGSQVSRLAIGCRSDHVQVRF